MKTWFMLVILTAVAAKTCVEQNEFNLNEATCGDPNKVAACIDKDGNGEYLAKKPRRQELNVIFIEESAFVSHIDYSCPFDDDYEFHEQVIAHHESEDVHLLKLASGSFVVVSPNQTYIHNMHNNVNCTKHHLQEDHRNITIYGTYIHN